MVTKKTVNIRRVSTKKVTVEEQFDFDISNIQPWIAERKSGNLLRRNRKTEEKEDVEVNYTAQHGYTGGSGSVAENAGTLNSSKKPSIHLAIEFGVQVLHCLFFWLGLPSWLGLFNWVIENYNRIFVSRDEN